MEDITPLEEAVLNAHEFAAGLASMGIVHDMVQRSEESSKAMRDRELPREIRVQALQDSRACLVVIPQGICAQLCVMVRLSGLVRSTGASQEPPVIDTPSPLIATLT